MRDPHLDWALIVVVVEVLEWLLNIVQTSSPPATISSSHDSINAPRDESLLNVTRDIDGACVPAKACEGYPCSRRFRSFRSFKPFRTVRFGPEQYLQDYTRGSHDSHFLQHFSRHPTQNHDQRQGHGEQVVSPHRVLIEQLAAACGDCGAAIAAFVVVATRRAVGPAYYEW